MSLWAMEESSFYHCCHLLLQQSNQLKDGWSWEGSKEGYLKKTSFRSVIIDSRPLFDLERSCSEMGHHTSSPSVPDQWLDEKEQSAIADGHSLNGDMNDEDDLVYTVSETRSELLQYEYHILYSCSYSTPVLFFRAFTQAGRSLSLEDVWSSVHQNFRLRLQDSPLNVISLQEHPLLGQPFFMLHPCRTDEFMRPVLQAALDQHRSMNYLLSWLSLVGPVVGLDVPLEYYTQHCLAASLSSIKPD
ncbi:ubiquitin-like-conjugating enzyme ATG10 isoform X2 [Antennarius striatus]|uniref:ubiquitin-like-conjugating enzyme ATG10 isoform X2 n=1 Tax=Antennarius striatus TaxID=241820 RepID=UPI0035B4977F